MKVNTSNVFHLRHRNFSLAQSNNWLVETILVIFIIVKVIFNHEKANFHGNGSNDTFNRNYYYYIDLR